MTILLTFEKLGMCHPTFWIRVLAHGDVDYNGTKCNPAFAKAVMCIHVNMELVSIPVPATFKIGTSLWISRSFLFVCTDYVLK